MIKRNSCHLPVLCPVCGTELSGVLGSMALFCFECNSEFLLISSNNMRGGENKK